MLFEWYSGSDATDHVAKAIADLDRRFDALDSGTRRSILLGLLEIEQDANWRGYLLARIGLGYKLDCDTKNEVAYFEKALRSFEPLRRNISDVLEMYAASMYYLIQDELFDAGDMERVAELGFALVTRLDGTSLDSFERQMVFAYLGRALNQLGHSAHAAGLFYRMALTCNLLAHGLSTEDEGFLEALVYSYFNVGDRERCRLAYEMLRQVGAGTQALERVELFLQERGEPNDDNTHVPY